MAEPNVTSGQIRFGDGFELDARAYQLRRRGRAVKVERIPLEILLMLAEHRGELVTREQIAERVWGKDVFFDTDNGINVAIRKVRQTLKDSPDQPKYIQTVSGRGYRFIAALAPEQAAPEAAISAREPLAGPSRSRLRLGMAVALVSAAVLLVTLSLWPRRAASPPSAARLALAVLPFANLTGDPAQEYFSDGLTEEMITRLGSLDPAHLGVVAHTSVMQYKRGGRELQQVGRELGVQYVLTGSVRHDGGKVRIAAQLIQARDGTRVWAREYDRELSQLLPLQAEIAHEIADEIHLTLGGRGGGQPAPGAGATTTPEAYDLYLKGQYFLNQRTIAGLEKATEFFGKATEMDPGFARAYAGEAAAYALLASYTLTPPEQHVAKARAAALRALQLDERLPEAHTTLALIVENYDWDWATAEKEYRRALELNPNYATAHQWYAEELMWRGQFDEALRQMEQARQLDPRSLIIASDNGAILYYARQYDRALEQFRAVLDLEPHFPRAQLIIFVQAEQGKYHDALARLKFNERAMSPGWYWANYAYLQGRAGRHAEAARALRELQRIAAQQRLDPAPFVWAYLALGDKQKCLDWLDRAYAEHSLVITNLKVGPAFDPLRSEPRFQELMKRVGLAN